MTSRKPPIALTRWLRAGEARFRAFAAHRGRSVVLVLVLAVVLRLALLPFTGFPAPQVHDEFSYLLGADTFTSGRMTNPPHPLWLFFETFQELQQPTYQSKYPPAQAAFLSVGQIIFGHPWFGVLLSTALLCAASCWMLQAWVPCYIALLGGVLTALHVAGASYWVNTYWGGSVAALGGCLVLGGTRHLLRAPRATHWLAVALGIALLANSRPYEGLVLVLSCAVVFVIWTHKDRRKKAALLDARKIIPALTVLACVGGGMLFYNSRVTESPWTMPIQAHERQYAMTSPFRFTPLGPEPVYHTQVLHDGWAVHQVALWQDAREHPLAQLQHDLGDLFRFFPGLSPVWLPLLAFPFALGRRDARLIALLAALFTGGMLLEGIVQPHYAAPGFALAILMIAFGFRYLRLLARATTRDGLTASRLIAVLSILVPIAPAYQFAAVARDRTYRAHDTIAKSVAAKSAAKDGRRAVILVRYSAHHDPAEEWVFNTSHIDESPVIWARDRGPAEDRQLLEYYRDREVWLFEPDSEPPLLQRFTPDSGKITTLDARSARENSEVP